MDTEAGSRQGASMHTAMWPHGVASPVRLDAVCSESAEIVFGDEHGQVEVTVVLDSGGLMQVRDVVNEALSTAAGGETG